LDTTVNRQIGEFVIEEQIGEGFSARVYRAYQPTINRYVALKVIAAPTSPNLKRSEVFERKFTQEAQVFASLEHPHIVPIYHYGMIDDGDAYVAMRLMRESLDVMLTQGALDSQRVIDITLQLLEGLGYAHKRGILHQGIKPENILFDESGSACLADFGLARVTAQTMDVTRPNFVLEKAIYVAPEQIRSSYVDPRSDIYSVGVVMYQMLTGHLPFEGETFGIDALLQKIEFEDPIPPRKLNSQVMPELERIVLQALRKEARERFFDVNEMTEALEAIPGTRVRLRPAKLRFLPSPKGRAGAAHRLRILVMTVLLVVGVVILIILSVSIFRQQNRPLQPATIEASVVGNVADIAPSAGEITQAQHALGMNGFIAYIACAMDSQFQSVRAREMNDDAQTDGLAFRVYDSGNDDYKQLVLIEQARLEGAKAIILCPLSPDVLSESLTSIQSAGLPLVLTNALPKSYGGVMLSQDNHQIGVMVGRFVAQTLTKNGKTTANVVILDAPKYPFSEVRVQGFLDGLSENIPNQNVIGRYPTGVDQAGSQAEIAKLINNGQRIDTIFSVMDTGTYGAIAALSAAQIDPNSVVIASVNAESAALDHIVRGDYLRATVDIGLDAGSRGAFDAAVKLLGGGTLPQTVTLPSGILITRDIILGQSPSS